MLGKNMLRIGRIAGALLSVAALIALGISCESTDVGPTTEHGKACGGIFCDVGTLCMPDAGQCVDAVGYCATVSCGIGQTCSIANGKCVADPEYKTPCIGIVCEGEDMICHGTTGQCVHESAVCGGVGCGINQGCDPDTGICIPIDACKDVTCKPWETCVANLGDAAGQCVSAQCDGGGCPTNMECQDTECAPRSCAADHECPYAYPTVCSGGQCRVPTCTSNDDCEDPNEEDEIAILCVQGTCGVAGCSADAPCGDNFACVLNVCIPVGCTGDGECAESFGEDWYCESSTLQCVEQFDKECYSDGDCGPDGDCVDSYCVSHVEGGVLGEGAAPGADEQGTTIDFPESDGGTNSEEGGDDRTTEPFDAGSFGEGEGGHEDDGGSGEPAGEAVEETPPSSADEAACFETSFQFEDQCGLSEECLFEGTCCEELCAACGEQGEIELCFPDNA